MMLPGKIKYAIVMLLMIVFIFFAQSQVDSRTRFFSSSGSYSSPTKLFADSYNPSYGFSFSRGFLFGFKGEEDKFSLSLNFSRDLVNLKNSVATRLNVDKNTRASILTLQIGIGEITPIASIKSFRVLLSSGRSLGGARFSIGREIYERLGQSTLSELKSENAMIQISSAKQFGILLSVLDRISLGYSYGFMNIERAWMPWHTLISAIIEGVISYAIIELPPYFIFPRELRRSPLFRPVKGIYEITMDLLLIFLRYDFDYKHHHWPFDDYPPLRYHKQALTLIYYF